MGFGWLFLLIGVLWLLQLLLAYQQAQRFMARSPALRRGGGGPVGAPPPRGGGRVSIGAPPRQVRGRAYAVIAVAPDDRIAAAEALSGVTVFANARPVPALVGLRAADLAAGTDVP